MNPYQSLLYQSYLRNPRDNPNALYQLRTMDDQDRLSAEAQGPNIQVGPSAARPSMHALSGYGGGDPSRSTADDLAGMPQGTHVGGDIFENSSLDTTMSPEGAAGRRADIAAESAQTAARAKRDIAEADQVDKLGDIGRGIPQVLANAQQDVTDVNQERDNRRYFDPETNRRRRFELQDALSQLQARYSDPAWARYQGAVDSAGARAQGQVDSAVARGQYGNQREQIKNQGVNLANQGREGAAAITASGRQGNDVSKFLPQQAPAPGKTFSLEDVRRIANDQGASPFEVFQAFNDNGYTFSPSRTPGVGGQ